MKESVDASHACPAQRGLTTAVGKISSCMSCMPCRTLVQQGVGDNLRMHHMGLDDIGLQSVTQLECSHCLLGNQWPRIVTGHTKCPGNELVHPQGPQK